MAKEFNRTDRVGELIQRELARLLQREFRTDASQMITVTAVKMSRDLSHAKVYITSLNQTADAVEEAEVKRTLAMLDELKPALRHQLGKQVKLRIVPDLNFVYDQSLAHGNYLSGLIEQAVASDTKEEPKG